MYDEPNAGRDEYERCDSRSNWPPTPAAHRVRTRELSAAVADARLAPPKRPHVTPARSAHRSRRVSSTHDGQEREHDSATDKERDHNHLQTVDHSSASVLRGRT